MANDIPCTPAGWQCVFDLYECATGNIDDLDWVRATMIEAAHVAQATIITDNFHRFEPHGLSGVVVIAESHIAIHTWPERRYAAIDVFTCNSRLLVDAAARFLACAFAAGVVRKTDFTRGEHMILKAVPDRLAASGPTAEWQEVA